MLRFIQLCFLIIGLSLFLCYWFPPFAQLGFIGAKLFNVITVIITIYFTVQSAQLLQLKRALLVAVVLIATPYYFVITFSGLTEPLFACFISISLWASLNRKHYIAAILISFLPFVRSEGLFFIAIYGLYFILKKEWKMIPLLLLGHVVYSFAGYFVYRDILWVFTKIPYAKLSSTYGSGGLFHFVDQLYYVIGLPIYLLFGIGVLKSLYDTIQRKISLEWFVLCGMGFVVFFVAHTLFWYLGIFNSMGLKRVLICVIPLIALFALMGLNFILDDLLHRWKKTQSIIQLILVAYLALFPVIPNPAAIHWKRDLCLTTEQKCVQKVAAYITQNKSESARIFCTFPYLSEILNIDHFNPNVRVDLFGSFMQDIKPRELIIWDSWFAVVECGLPQADLDQNPHLKKVFETRDRDHEREIVFAIYEKK